MLRSILIGLDGSTYSTAAADLGIQWAQRFDAVLVGLGIVDEPTIRRPEPIPLGGSAFKTDRDDALVIEARRDVEQFLQRFARRCGDAGVTCRLVEEIGLPSEQILLEAQRHDLLLLGKQTYYRFDTQDRSDETLRVVVKDAPRPVVTVPERVGKRTSVVIAYDGSLQAARTLQAFQALGLGQGVEVHIVSIHAEYAEAARHADRALDFLNSHKTEAVRHPIATSSPPAAAILEQVQLLRAGLLVMGAYGQPVLREFLFGSVTRTTLKETTVPLFLYH